MILPRTPIVIASRNRGKIAEIDTIFGQYGIMTRSILDYEQIKIDEEHGSNYADNAFEKALQAYTLTGLPSLADDSGIEIAAMNHGPGHLSARFLGPGASDADKNRRILEILHNSKHGEREARFVCVMVLAIDDSLWITCQGIATGTIAMESRGVNGFGYDPLFIPDGFDRTFAEMPADLKNSISHRGRALARMAEFVGCLVSGGKITLPDQSPG